MMRIPLTKYGWPQVVVLPAVVILLMAVFAACTRAILESWIIITVEGILFIVLISFVIHVGLLSFATQFRAIFSGIRPANFQVGEPAPRDIVVDKDITYIDEQATAMRREAVAGLVSPVFVINSDITMRALQNFTDFLASFTDARTKSASAEKIYLEIQADLPGFFTI